MQKRTKILATVGPSSDTIETLSALIKAGVNVFRLNFSHGTHAYHTEVLSNIRIAMRETGLIVGVLQDISGPKIRVGKLSEDFHFEIGDRLDFQYETCEGTKIGAHHYCLSINQSDILCRLNVSDAIYLHDGNIRARVVSISDTGVQAKIENKGKGALQDH